LLGQALHARGDYREAVAQLAEVLEATAGPLKHDLMGMATLPSVQNRFVLAWCKSEQGDFDGARPLAREAMEIAAPVDAPYSLVAGHFALGHIALRQGDLPAAISPLERALHLSRTYELATWFPQIASALGYACALMGRQAEAASLLEDAVRRAELASYPCLQALRLAYLSEVRLLMGDHDAAITVATSARDLAQRCEERGSEAWALRLLGEIAAHADPPDVESAQAHYSQALARADELGMRPLAAHCHLGLGKLYRRTGDGVKAEEYLQTATAMYREMGMIFWLEKAEAELGPPHKDTLKHA
jgi:tetratricopeptide (TPR) repeat protein